MYVKNGWPQATLMGTPGNGGCRQPGGEL